MPKKENKKEKAFSDIEKEAGVKPEAETGPVRQEIHKVEDLLQHGVGEGIITGPPPKGGEMPPKGLSDAEKHAIHEALAMTIANITYPVGSGAAGRPATKEEFVEAMKGVTFIWDAIGFADTFSVVETLSNRAKLIIGILAFGAIFLTYHPTINWGSLLGKGRSLISRPKPKSQPSSPPPPPPSSASGAAPEVKEVKFEKAPGA